MPESGGEKLSKAKSGPALNQLSVPDALVPAAPPQPTAAGGRKTISPASPRGSPRARRRKAAGAGGRALAGPRMSGRKVGNSERGLRNTISGRLSASVRAGEITPSDRDALHVAAIRLFRAKPVEFAGPSGQQTTQHLRHLQGSIVSLIADRVLADAGGGTTELLEKIIADVNHDLGPPPGYSSFNVNEIAKAAESKIVAAVYEATHRAGIESNAASEVARIGGGASEQAE